MAQKAPLTQKRQRYVLNTKGGPLTRETLIAELKEARLFGPEAQGRWTPRRRADVVIAIDQNVISFDEARQWFGWSEEESKSNIALFHDHGIKGLRATKLQDFR